MTRQNGCSFFHHFIDLFEWLRATAKGSCNIPQSHDAGTEILNETEQDTDAGPEALPPIHFAFTVHLEGHALATEEAVTRYFDNIQAYADLAIEHGLPVTWEVRNILDHLEADTNHLLLTLQAEGHGVGFHADSGGRSHEPSPI